MSPQTTPNILNIEPLPSVDERVIEDDTPLDNFFSAKLQRLLVSENMWLWKNLGYLK